MVIVITGASRGIGKAIAEEFGADKQGHTFILCARNEQTLQSFAMELQARFPRTTVWARAADLSIKEEVTAWIAWTLTHTGRVDVLVNNAGSFVPGGIITEEEGALEKMITTNLYSAYHITRGLLPLMTDQKAAHIFNICSIASLQAYPNGGAYSISKFALYGFSKNLREELKPKGVKVTAVMPGAVLTDSWEGFDNSEGRIMEVSDIAKLIYTAAQLTPQACVEEILIRPQLGDL